MKFGLKVHETLEYLDFKNKYYRIDDCGSIYYFYVRSQVVGEYLSTEKPGLQLKGLGFYIPQSDDYIDFFLKNRSLIIIGSVI